MGAGLPTPASSTYLSSKEVAALLHVSTATVARWARASRLPYVRTLGGHRRYPAETVFRIVERLTLPAPASTAETREPRG